MNYGPNTPALQNNGRVNYVSGQQYPDYPMFEQNRQGLGQYKCEAVKTILERTQLSDVFFSKHNIDYLQGQIIQRVYQLSGNKFRIGRQSDTELEVVMRSIFLQFSRNDSNDIRGQIRQLDQMVVDEVVPGIITAVQQHTKYLEDISQMYTPIDRPAAMSNKGEKTLTLKPWF